MAANNMSSDVSSAGEDKSILCSETETEAESETDFSLSKSKNDIGESSFNVGNISVNETGRKWTQITDNDHTRTFLKFTPHSHQ